MQLQVNYLDWEDPVIQARACMEVAQRHGVPVTIMEPARGGRLAELPERVAEPLRAAAPEATLASWAYRFCFNLPNVITVLSGMSTIEQARENVATFQANKPFSDDEQRALDAASEVLRSLASVPCTNCRYLREGVPAGGVITPEIMSLINLELMTENNEFVKDLYQWQAPGRASSCVACGACEAMCPQSIDIIHQLEVAKDHFEGRRSRIGEASAGSGVAAWAELPIWRSSKTGAATATCGSRCM